MEKIEIDDRYRRQFRDMLMREIEKSGEYETVRLSQSGLTIIVRAFDSFEYRISLNVAGYEV